MTKKRIEKPKVLQKLEKSIAEILIARDNNLKPFIHSFHHEPENILHQPLGILLGIFEVEDHSKDSAYIVNFLASVAKKEYFSHPKRPAIESLEAALHKVNLALAELIKHDNTAWLGRLNAAVCVLEKHNLHFSVAGSASTLLIRNGLVTDISEGLVDPDQEPHPLKTFTEVASGRLKADDTVLIATPELFEIVSFDEIRRNSQRFSKEQFLQFLRTASVNQMTLGGALVIDVYESAEPVPEKKTRPKQEEPAVLNAFSQTAFAPKNKENSVVSALSEAEETKSADTEYTDTKTGHIYVQGDQASETVENERWRHIQWLIEEQFRSASATIVRVSGKYKRSLAQSTKQHVVSLGGVFVSVWRTTRPKIVSVSKTLSNQATQATKTVAQSASQSWNAAREARASRTKEREVQSAPSSPKTSIPVQVRDKQEEVYTFSETPKPYLSHLAQVSLSSTPSRIASSKAIAPQYNGTLSKLSTSGTHLFEKISPHLKTLLDKLPHPSDVSLSFQKLRAKQKQVALGALVLIIVAPLAFVLFAPKAKPIETKPSQPESTPAASALPTEPGMQSLSNLTSLYRQNQSLKVLLLDGKPYLLAERGIVSLEKPGQATPVALPDGSAIKKATAMDDLNALFLLSQNGKLFSFTPSNHVFTENTIAIPDAASVSDMSSYLTYLYISNTKNDAIYRYPRTEGGFGAGQNWLKTSAVIDDTSSIAINENLYLNNSSGIQTFYQGKSVTFTPSSKLQPLAATALFTAPDDQNIYILDAEHKKIAVVSKTGDLVKQYTHINLEKAVSLAANEETKTIYFTTPSETFSFPME